MFTCAFLPLVLLPFAAAQAPNSNNIDFELEVIKANFNQSHLVPNFLPSFEPEGYLDVNFNRNISPGQEFAKEQVAKTPVLTIQSKNSLNKQYTLAMMDADVTDTNTAAIGTNRHWLLYNVTVDQTTQAVSNATATTITPYAGPGPAPGSGPHRYVILIYDQPSDFAPPAEFSTPGLSVAPMDWNAFVTNSHLGNLIAANYFQVEEGTATVAVPSTAPVNTATLAPVSAAASSSISAPSSSPTTAGNSAHGLSVSVFGTHATVAIAIVWAAFITFLI